MFKLFKIIILARKVAGAMTEEFEFVVSERDYDDALICANEIKESTKYAFVQIFSVTEL